MKADSSDAVGGDASFEQEEPGWLETRGVTTAPPHRLNLLCRAEIAQNYALCAWCASA